MAYKSFIVAASALVSFAAGQTYQGDGTFYGAGGAGKQGACMLNPGFNRVGITVAMNQAQFQDGAACGKCVRISGKGEGLGGSPIVGPIFATVDNLCPECSHGDVDLGLAGDGRWRITWQYVDCKDAREAPSSLPHRMGNRQLRGAQADESTVLKPGFMVTPTGIKSIADVLDEQAKLMAEAEASAEQAKPVEGGNH